MKKLVAGVLATGALLAGAGAAVAAPPTFGDSVIVEVEGNAADGFGIHYYDGSAKYVPTDSEARAECSEYDTVRGRVRCRTSVRQWYADLREVKRSLRWALAQ
jgi:hypothetical protein